MTKQNSLPPPRRVCFTNPALPSVKKMAKGIRVNCKPVEEYGNPLHFLFPGLITILCKLKLRGGGVGGG
jgi:hypothetical protein